MGEVVEVRGNRACLADTYGFDKRDWVVLPEGCTWRPGLAYMVVFEGSTRAFVDEERGTIDVRFLAKSWEDCGPSIRHGRQHDDLDDRADVEAGRIALPPKVTSGLHQSGARHLRGSAAVSDFIGQLEDTIGTHIQVMLIAVVRYDEESNSVANAGAMTCDSRGICSVN